MNSDQVKSLVRNVLLGLGAGAGGTWLASKGIGGEQWEAIVGAVLAIGSVLWSQLHHAKNG